MNATTIRLWLIRETPDARKYGKSPHDTDGVWIPRSVIEHTTKRGNEHHVKLPDWFIEKKGL